MYELTVSAAFDSAHFLHGYAGKCANLHGHRWVIEVTAAWPELQTQGQQRDMAIDFSDFKKAVRAVADAHDHALLYETSSLRPETEAALQAEHFHLIALPFRPTAERLAAYFHALLAAQGLPVRRVTVFETPENRATFTPEAGEGAPS